MFKHILIPTDGSRLSAKAIRMAVRLARDTGAKVTGAYVIAPYTPPVYGEAAIYVAALSAKRYKELTAREARKALAEIEIEARTSGVGYSGTTQTGYNPWEGILRAAKAKKCDLIVMASHGRRGLAGLLLGSETTKVLTHSKIPVLVCR
jgi:nucleotide-binding universal stress UspA family protein